MLDLPWLNPHSLDFPPIDQALSDPNGLLAVGGDLAAPRLVEAYRRGIFPWYEDDQLILWWSPDPRLVLVPQDVHISKSMRKIIRQGQFRVSADSAFEMVISTCSNISREGQRGTWITEDMMDAYIELHHQGYAHSIEVWQDDALVGGLYGIAIGSAFFGESMFSLASNASKMALIALTQYLQSRGYRLIDCQMETDHLKSMGAVVINRDEFKSIIKQTVKQESESHFKPHNWRETFTESLSAPFTTQNV